MGSSIKRNLSVGGTRFERERVKATPQPPRLGGAVTFSISPHFISHHLHFLTSISAAPEFPIPIEVGGEHKSEKIDGNTANKGIGATQPYPHCGDGGGDMQNDAHSAF
jgi:hypothetical protein